jgi:hypothetical protein
MRTTIQNPEHYLPSLNAYRKAHKSFRAAPLCIKKLTHKKRDSNGYPHGYYVLSPLDVVLGKWNQEKDELQHINIKRWNEQAYELSKY